MIESINQSATKLSQIFESVGVSDIGRKSVLISTGTVTFGIEITSASFHDVGTCACCSEALKIEDIPGVPKKLAVFDLM